MQSHVLEMGGCAVKKSEKRKDLRSGRGEGRGPKVRGDLRENTSLFIIKLHVKRGRKMEIFVKRVRNMEE